MDVVDTHEGPVPLKLGDGSVSAISVPYPLDGRVSTHPVEFRGYAPSNIYLISEPDQALLIDSGYSAHAADILSTLDRLLAPDTPLYLWCLRIGEFPAVCNARLLAEHYNLVAIYGIQGDPTTWVDFSPDFSPFGTPPVGGALRDVEGRLFRAGDTIELGKSQRSLRALDAPLRLLPANWVYDERTRTLFTEDAFTWGWRPSADGPWVLDGRDDGIDVEQVTAYLRGSRYWWLPGASTARIRKEIAAIFSGREVENIAPAFGSVIRGKDAVDRHLELMHAALKQFETEESAGVTVGSWRVNKEENQIEWR